MVTESDMSADLASSDCDAAAVTAIVAAASACPNTYTPTPANAQATSTAATLRTKPRRRGRTGTTPASSDSATKGSPVAAAKGPGSSEPTGRVYDVQILPFQ